jgi:hypothetical protein
MFFYQKVLEKLDESLTVFPISHLPIHRVIVPTIRAKEMTVLLGSRMQSWDALLLPLFHPAGM